MVNLLPYLAKKQVYKEYLFRRVIILFLLLIFSLLIGAVLISPAFFLAEIKEREATKQLTQTENTATAQEESGVETIVRSVNKKISIFTTPSDKEERVSRLFLTVIDARTNGTLIDGLSFETREENKVLAKKIVVSGKSPRRESLTAFADILRQNAIFKNVDLPTANLVRSADLPFSITPTF